MIRDFIADTTVIDDDSAPGNLATSRIFAKIAETTTGLASDKTLGIGELITQLLIQIGAIRNQHNRRTGKVHALHQQAGEARAKESLANIFLSFLLNGVFVSALRISLRAKLLLRVLIES